MSWISLLLLVFISANAHPSVPLYFPSTQNLIPGHFQPIGYEGQQPQPLLLYQRTSSLIPLLRIYYRLKNPLQCRSNGIFPYPYDCRRFFKCEFNEAENVFLYQERVCPQGLAFDSKLESCNYQSFVADCPQVMAPPKVNLPEAKPKPDESLVSQQPEYQQQQQQEEEPIDEETTGVTLGETTQKKLPAKPTTEAPPTKGQGKPPAKTKQLPAKPEPGTKTKAKPVATTRRPVSSTTVAATTVKPARKLPAKKPSGTKSPPVVQKPEQTLESEPEAGSEPSKLPLKGTKSRLTTVKPEPELTRPEQGTKTKVSKQIPAPPGKSKKPERKVGGEKKPLKQVIVEQSKLKDGTKSSKQLMDPYPFNEEDGFGETLAEDENQFGDQFEDLQ